MTKKKQGPRVLCSGNVVRHLVRLYPGHYQHPSPELRRDVEEYVGASASGPGWVDDVVVSLLKQGDLKEVNRKLYPGRKAREGEK